MKQKDYSYINTVDDLKEEIERVKYRIHQHKEALENRWQHLPAETIKAAMGSVIPTSLVKNITRNLWQFVRAGIGMLILRKNSESKKQEMKSAAGKVGIYTILGALLSRFRRK